MDSWIVDADGIDIDQTGRFRNALFHENTAIDSFLELDSKRTIIAAPKGNGKTLLLKAKRANLPPEYSFLPRNLLVDKATGVPNLSTKLTSLLSQPEHWKSLWLIAISIAIIKDKYEETELESLSDQIKSSDVKDILKDEHLDTPCSLIQNIVKIKKSTYHQLENLYASRLSHNLRSIRNQYGVFIDNTDEFFEQELYKNREDLEKRPLYKSMWDACQIGLALATRDLRLINPHIKVFASIRKEVIPDILTSTPLAIQIGGATTVLQYRYEELIDILDKNIKNEKSENLFTTSPAHEVAEWFFGIDKLYYIHPRTGDEEHVYDYLLRHTLGRPRDIAHIGSEVASANPSVRTPKRIKDIVNREAGVLAEAYFTEMLPHVDRLNTNSLFSLLDRNYFDLSELEAISEKYDEMNGIEKEDSAHVFCNLYKLGLLGVIETDIQSGLLRQKFATPGSISLSASNCLPDSTVYLLHPMLDDLVAEKNRDYRDGMNRTNIIGHGLPWRATRSFSFVAKGDVKEFSKIMEDEDKYHEFLLVFKQKILEVVNGTSYRIEGGDSVLFVEESPIELIRVCANLSTSIEKRFGHSVRFGLDVGYIEQLENSELKGGVLRRSARLEAAVKFSGLFCSDKFIEEATKMKMAIDGASCCKSVDLPHLEYEDGLFNLSKGELDEPVWTSIWKIQPEQSAMQPITSAKM
ncbi:hypothetical protein [Lentilitoribacter sp. Alg239-R112]|uniref:P-loop ATPase, Sll1717 family n=1 Tax=Lentilitoribacter sp. Alg239-R112 TaxID=2305987 RepID=UPI0013A6E95A|nr:hypothetical protein [Lentilitoribacter sp. Alg239-R112]